MIPLCGRRGKFFGDDRPYTHKRLFLALSLLTIQADQFPGPFFTILQNVQVFFCFFYVFCLHAERVARPLLRLLFKMALPELVMLLLRNPCVLLRLIFDFVVSPFFTEKLLFYFHCFNSG